MKRNDLVVRLCLSVALALGAFSARAGGMSEVRKQAEASMLLTGTVEVAPDGSLRGYRLDQPEKIDSSVLDFVDRNIKSWSFEVGSLPPGVPAEATIRNSMSILVVAKPLDGDSYTLRLAASHFRAENPLPGSEVAYKHRRVPVYPQAAVYAGVEGQVFLLVKIAPDGTVEDAMAEQVNLGVVARSETEMERWRRVLAASALRSVRTWTFVVPAQGELAQKPYFLARVPVAYEFRNKKRAEYGDWTPYVPGPRHANQWEPQDDNPGFSPDALAANGGVYSGGGLRLKSPLQAATHGG